MTSRERMLTALSNGRPDRLPCTRDHAGYICCPSDHFFRGDPACLQAFAEEARGCVY